MKRIGKKPLVLAFIVLSTVLAIIQVACPAFGDMQASGYQTANAAAPGFSTADVIQNDNTVNVGVWLINMFGFQYTSGDYIADMYVYFYWTNPNITTIDWHFANGYPVTPTSVTLIGNMTNGNLKAEVYRATANLNSPPDASDFPFDKINITVAINLVPHGNNLTLTWMTNQTGVDSKFANPGWKTTNLSLESSINDYPLGIEVPKATMVVTQERQRSTQSFSPFIPPIFFAIVCGVSFMFSLKEMAAVGLRIGLNTSMLVTTLLFSFGISSSIPPASSMVLYTIFLLSILLFMVSNLVVTIIGVVGWLKYKDEKRTTKSNKLGFVISIIVPVVVFTLFYLLK
jgi:hypothetical protein